MALELGFRGLGWSPLSPSAFAMMMQGTECADYHEVLLWEEWSWMGVGVGCLQLQCPALAHFKGFSLLRGRLPQCHGDKRNTCCFSNRIGSWLGIRQRNPINEVRLHFPSKTIFFYVFNCARRFQSVGLDWRENSCVIWDWTSICSLWTHFKDLCIIHNAPLAWDVLACKAQLFLSLRHWFLLKRNVCMIGCVHAPMNVYKIKDIKYRMDWNQQTYKNTR